MTPFYDDGQVTIYCADVRTVDLAEVAACVVTSPPYNVGLDYDGGGDWLGWAEYRALADDTAGLIPRALVPGGRAWVNTAVSVPEVPDGGHGGKRRVLLGHLWASALAADRLAHDRENLGYGGRRVLVSRRWTGKTLAGHRADRASVVRAALEEAGIDPDDHDELAITGSDGRWEWEVIGRARIDDRTYTEAIVEAVTTRQRWRRQYETARQRAGPHRPAVEVGSSATTREETRRWARNGC